MIQQRLGVICAFGGLTLIASAANLLMLHAKAGENRFARLDPPRTAEELASDRASIARQIRESGGGKFHKALMMHVDFPGLEQPILHDLDEIDLPDSAAIIGIEVDGEACAFVLSRMVDPKTHIVNMTMNQKAISVTYCDLTDCVRVFSDDSATRIPIHVGGLDTDRSLVLLSQGIRYGHMSSHLPHDDYPFARMNLGDWKRKHPGTKVCVPPIKD